MRNKLFTGYLTSYFILVIIYLAYNISIKNVDLEINDNLFYTSVIFLLFAYYFKIKIEFLKYLKKSTEQFKTLFYQYLISKNKITLIIILNIFLSRILTFREGLLFTNFRNSKSISQFKKGHAPPLT